MWVAARLHRTGETLLSITVAGLTSSVVSPFSWSHHWVWFVPLFVYLAHRALKNSWWWLAIVALFVAAGSWSYRWPDIRVVVGLYLFRPAWAPWDVLVNLYLVAYVAILGGAAAIAFRRSPATSKTSPSSVPSLPLAA